MACEPACPFCKLSPDRISISNGVAVAFRDYYPVTDGHTLVAPRQHVQSLFELTHGELTAIWSLVAEVRSTVRRDLSVTAFNIGINDGAVAGQTVGHAHVHVIPRRPGDVPDPRGGVRWVIPQKAKYWID